MERRPYHSVTRDAWPVIRGCALGFNIAARGAPQTFLFRAGGGYLVPLFAAQSRHEEPYPPMSKINFLALVRVSWQ